MRRKGRLSALILGLLVFVAVWAQAASRLTFSTPVELCENCYGQDIAVDASGKVLAVWTTTAGLELRASADGGTTFTPVATHAALKSGGGEVAIDPTGNLIHLVWMGADLLGPQCGPPERKYLCQDVFYARSVDGGRTFSTPTNIAQAEFDVLLPRIAIDTTGQVVNLVWSQHTTADCCAREVYFSRSTDGGIAFSPPRRLSALQDSIDVDIATDVWSNVVNVVWWVHSAGGRVRQVYFVRSTDGGVTFSDAKLLGDGQYPTVANDATGHIVNVAYAQSGIRFIRSVDGGASFSSPKVISKAGYQPSIIADGAGNLIDLVWSEGGGETKSWVRFARSSNGGATFSQPQTIANVSQRYVLRPDLAVDGNGNIHAIWAEWSAVTYASDIYYSRGTP